LLYDPENPLNDPHYFNLVNDFLSSFAYMIDIDVAQKTLASVEKEKTLNSNTDIIANL